MTNDYFSLGAQTVTLIYQITNTSHSPELLTFTDEFLCNPQGKAAACTQATYSKYEILSAQDF